MSTTESREPNTSRRRNPLCFFMTSFSSYEIDSNNQSTKSVLRYVTPELELGLDWLAWIGTFVLNTQKERGGGVKGGGT